MIRLGTFTNHISRILSPFSALGPSSLPHDNIALFSLHSTLFACFSHFFPSIVPLPGRMETCLCFARLQELLPNRILLISIYNPLYPITLDVLHQVFSPHGFVEKIVTFQKSAGQLLFCLNYLLSLSISRASFFKPLNTVASIHSGIQIDLETFTNIVWLN